MNRSELYQCARHNLIDTYMALGKASGKGSIFDEPGLSGFASAFPHPISNFAILEEATAELASKLKEVVENRPAFHVYVARENGLRRACSVMRKHQFRNTHTLFVMASQPGKEVGTLPLEKGESESRRLEIADFMMSQFPSSYPDWIKQEVLRSTAEAEGLELYAYEPNRERKGAIMLRRNDSCIGIYNLCVLESERGTGIGSLLVRMTQRLANRQQQPVILQCDKRLVTWYERLGFRNVGKIEVFVSSQNRW